MYINIKEKEKKERQVRRVKKRKGIKVQRVKPPTQSQATQILIGNEEQNGKQENKKKEAGSRSPTQQSWTIQSPSLAHRDHMVTLFLEQVIENETLNPILGN